MGKEDKVKAKAQEVKGMAKERVGEDAGDSALQAKGRMERVKGNLKQAAEKVKDAFKR
ncbi:CsbD family protein [Nonomuraea sp. NPDC046802]|uniref:CsbD family protein n=1 Tax=Nonomuraea sp. NPDC046802 TaxID=3154919 RepID=UPI0033EBCC71